MPGSSSSNRMSRNSMVFLGRFANRRRYGNMDGERQAMPWRPPVSDYAEILYEVTDRIATITLNRPERLNAYTGRMASSIRRAMAEAANDPAVRVIVITGAGRGFCAGADMDILSGQANAPAEGGPRRDSNEIEARFRSSLGPSLDNEFRDAERL